MLDQPQNEEQACKHCTRFFSQFQCAAQSHGECACPKCQGYCECFMPSDDAFMAALGPCGK